MVFREPYDIGTVLITATFLILLIIAVVFNNCCYIP